MLKRGTVRIFSFFLLGALQIQFWVALSHEGYSARQRGRRAWIIERLGRADRLEALSTRGGESIWIFSMPFPSTLNAIC